MNRTELYIKRFYQSLDIFQPYQLNIKDISRKLKLPVIFWSHSSELTKYKGIYKMFLNEKLNKQQRWQDFGHEIEHRLEHTGSQTNMYSLFLSYQESQAEYFSYHFCVPTFMLQQIKGVDAYKIMYLFNVEEDFAFRRLEMYKNKLISRRYTIGTPRRSNTKQKI